MCALRLSLAARRRATTSEAARPPMHKRESSECGRRILGEWIRMSKSRLDKSAFLEDPVDRLLGRSPGRTLRAFHNVNMIICLTREASDNQTYIPDYQWKGLLWSCASQDPFTAGRRIDATPCSYDAMTRDARPAGSGRQVKEKVAVLPERRLQQP